MYPPRAVSSDEQGRARPVAVILAAGKGTRMRSPLPKVLHPLAGAPLVLYPLRAAWAAGVGRVVIVVGHGGAQVREQVLATARGSIAFATQAEQRGTGDAVRCALPSLTAADDPVLILSGDVPLINAATLTALRDACERASGELSLATFRPDDPTGYGRLLRDVDGHVIGVREQRDASAAERAIGECNAGVYCARARLLVEALPRLGAANAQGEIYLTDLVAVAARRGAVLTVEVPALEVAGVNTPEQLAELERAYLEARAAS
ncbi:MAG: NTP transferase domain-containing protein [Nannocystaceae bacterium]